MLRITNLSKSYGLNRVINNGNLTIPSTGLHLIRGENGSGKTTLLKCLAGLVRFKGEASWYKSDLRDYVSTAFDDSAVHERLTGLQNLSALLDIPPRLVTAHPIIRTFLTRELLSRRSSSYSLGQRKKLKLAAAFASGRPCILLDEPGSGLDDHGRRALRLVLESIEASKCVIVSDHDAASYQDIASTTFTIRRGKVRPDREAMVSLR
ncbi:ABC transporter ATP-binding protein [Paenarthrobacter aurescens]|uniref:ABC transporter ATP-binding protein n=1 Tax=Paenarthrobacter aurescens TaxID=43663 RepID=UPI0021C1F0A2|nr:ATP-binding cassette domain-containing protein [Paenarthrobacter aurescens]MCT9868735.1 ATP-binding cassette domain-containing protein [Paenarthrobacter aurescens]